jgi:hypothetical protein
MPSAQLLRFMATHLILGNGRVSPGSPAAGSSCGPEVPAGRTAEPAGLLVTISLSGEAYGGADEPRRPRGRFPRGRGYGRQGPRARLWPHGPRTGVLCPRGPGPGALCQFARHRGGPGRRRPWRGGWPGRRPPSDLFAGGSEGNARRRAGRGDGLPPGARGVRVRGQCLAAGPESASQQEHENGQPERGQRVELQIVQRG